MESLIEWTKKRKSEPWEMIKSATAMQSPCQFLLLQCLAKSIYVLNKKVWNNQWRIPQCNADGATVKFHIFFHLLQLLLFIRKYSSFSFDRESQPQYAYFAYNQSMALDIIQSFLDREMTIKKFQSFQFLPIKYVQNNKAIIVCILQIISLFLLYSYLLFLCMINLLWILWNNLVIYKIYTYIMIL